MKTTIKILSAVLVIAIISSCKKNGTGGDATIEGHVKHHELHIPGAMVYIKYDAKEFPGADVSQYDANVQASMGDGHYKFEGMRMGNYYVYGVGYDSSITSSVYGGTPVKIKYSERKEIIDIDIPVVE